MELFKKELEEMSASVAETLNQELDDSTKDKDSRRARRANGQAAKGSSFFLVEKCIESLKQNIKDTNLTKNQDHVDEIDHADDQNIDDVFNDWRSRNAMSKINK